MRKYLYGGYEELIEEKNKEIERLNNEIKTLLKENGNKEKVIIKQNNIINELEKDLDDEINDYNGNIEIEKETLSGEFLRGNAFEADYLKSRLKNLKGEEK